MAPDETNTFRAMKNTPKITPVILCGGAGSRLWPLSRDAKPKQFHALFNDQTLLANTIARMPEGDIDGARYTGAMVLGSASLADVFERAFRPPAPTPAHVLLEPSIRDTAAAIAAAAYKVAKADPDALLIVVPSDARIEDHGAFRTAVTKAAKLATDNDSIMLIGIKPTRPETQYGYIERGEAMGDGFAVKQFREKPDGDTAAKYLASGNFYWNAGMFLFRAGRMADEFATRRPQIWACAKAAVDHAVVSGDGVYTALDPAAFDQATKLSIDYAIMEGAQNVGVVEAAFDWDDLGSWAQLYDAAQKDESGNALTGSVFAVQAISNLLRSDGPIVAVAGVDGLSVVAEDNKVLVVPTAQSALVKSVTQTVKAHTKGNIKYDRSKAAIKSWLFETCLPFWADAGVDLVHGGVHEALAFDGTPAPHLKKRLRVLPRQIYCFAHAAALGWDGMDDATLRALFGTLVSTGWHEEEGGFIHLYKPDGTVKDPMRDTYDQCFVLLGCAWLHRSKGWPEARHWADKTLNWMDATLTDPVHGGYLENSDKDLPRRANPHMHFLEAMLAWYEATGEEDYLNRAAAMVNLFQTHFFDAATGSLTEFFAQDWTPDRSGRIEPGHHYEWAWLLLRFNRHRETEGLVQQAKMLFATARAFGHHVATGAAADTMAPDGTDVSDRARCWPQTEALKCAIEMEKLGVPGATALRAQMVDVLFDHYLGQYQPGGWCDAINAEGDRVAADMPSSTFYHVFCALVEHVYAD
ncbi:MAG: AGE family epimerase/isomerase [Pseudomonadota bacterium]